MLFIFLLTITLYSYQSFIFQIIMDEIKLKYKKDQKWEDYIKESNRFSALSSPEMLVIVEIINEHSKVGVSLSFSQIYEKFCIRVGEDKSNTRQIRYYVDKLEKMDILKKVLKSDDIKYTLIENFKIDNKSMPITQLYVFSITSILCLITFGYSIFINQITDIVKIALSIELFIIIQNLAMLIDYQLSIADYTEFFSKKFNFENFKKIFSKISKKFEKI